ncbi:hypothetical protein GCM10027605_08550 [Micromonospora zhanjiangensis]
MCVDLVTDQPSRLDRPRSRAFQPSLGRIVELRHRQRIVCQLAGDPGRYSHGGIEQDEPVYPPRCPPGQVDSHGGAQRVADDGHRFQIKRVHHGQHIGRVLFQGPGRFVRRSAVPAQIRCNDPTGGQLLAGQRSPAPTMSRQAVQYHQ